MSSRYISPTERRDITGTASIAANVTKLKSGFMHMTGAGRPKKGQFSKKEWDFVFEKMKTKSIPEIAAMDGVRISESRMYDMRRTRPELPRIKATPRISSEYRARRRDNEVENSRLLQTWR